MNDSDMKRLILLINLLSVIIISCSRQTQVLVDVQKRVFDNNPSANIYGITPIFRAVNMHDGWPRFIENMWMATNDCGLIAVAYGPNYVTARLGKDGRW